MTYQRNEFMWIFVVIGIVILITLIVSSAIIYGKIVGISNDVTTKLDDTNTLLTELNSKIIGLDELNKNINGIKEDISSIKTSIGVLPNNTASISNINNELVDIDNSLNSLAKIYPPNQTIVINNMKQEELNNLINNAVDLEFSKISKETNFNFWLNVVFGTISLFSLGGIAIYLVINRKKD